MARAKRLESWAFPPTQSTYIMDFAFKSALRRFRRGCLEITVSNPGFQIAFSEKNTFSVSWRSVSVNRKYFRSQKLFTTGARGVDVKRLKGSCFDWWLQFPHGTAHLNIDTSSHCLHNHRHLRLEDRRPHPEIRQDSETCRWFVDK